MATFYLWMETRPSEINFNWTIFEQTQYDRNNLEVELLEIQLIAVQNGYGSSCLDRPIKRVPGFVNNKQLV